MSDPKEWLRLAEWASRYVVLIGTGNVELRERITAIASALTAAADMAERWERHRESCGASQLSLAKACEELTAERDAARAEVERLTQQRDRAMADAAEARFFLVDAKDTADVACADLNKHLDAALAEAERLRADYQRCAGIIRDLGIDPDEGLP